MIISAIVAASKNRVIGLDNDLPWHMPADMKYFKETTSGHHIVLGRKNFESIGKPLPKRTNIIITRQKDLFLAGCVVVNKLEHAFEYAHLRGEDELFIIGGGIIYELALPFVDRIYYTEVDAIIEGDTFFPEIRDEQWEMVSEHCHQPDEENRFKYCFQIFERLKK